MTFDDISHYVNLNNGIAKNNLFSLNFNDNVITMQIDNNHQTLYIYDVIAKIQNPEQEDILLWIAKSNFRGLGTGLGHLGILPTENKLIYSKRIDISNLNNETLEIEFIKFIEWKKNIKKQCVEISKEFDSITIDNEDNSDSDIDNNSTDVNELLNIAVNNNVFFV